MMEHLHHNGYVVVQKRIQKLSLIAFFAAATAVGAYIKIPIPYVPLTMQTVFVLLSGSLLGTKAGMVSQVVYLLVGLSGFPVFTQGGGPGYVTQPTFGYLLAFPLAAGLAGMWTQNIFRMSQRLKFVKMVAAHFASLVPTMILGAIYLYLSMHLWLKSAITLRQALWSGCVIFLPADLLKAVLTSYLTIRLNTVMHPMR